MKMRRGVTKRIEKGSKVWKERGSKVWNGEEGVKYENEKRE